MTTMRPYQTIEDYWRIRAFLRDVYLRNGRRALSWPLYRFDYWRWHGLENLHPGEPPIFLWENEGQIVAVLNAEEPGEGFMHVDPDLRSPTLESEMLAIAEDNLAIAPELGVRALIVWADAGDALRHEVRWNGTSDVSALAGKPVMLHFTMKKAELFSFAFRKPQGI